MSFLHRHVRSVTAQPVVRQFVKFSLVGASNTVIDFGTYILLTRVFAVHFLQANTVAFVCAASWSYFWNRTWTFRSSDANIRKQYIKFLIVATIGLGITTGLLYVLVMHTGMDDLVAKVIAVGAVLIWNFFVNRFWTFRTSLV